MVEDVQADAEKTFPTGEVRDVVCVLKHPVRKVFHTTGGICLFDTNSQILVESISAFFFLENFQSVAF